MVKSNPEFKVGIFVLIGLTILAAMILFVRDFRLFEKGYHFKVVFNYTGGLDKGAPVRVAGVEVGRVDKIILVNKKTTKVQLKVWVKEEVQIYQDAEVFINTMGLLGEKYIEITPGTAEAPLLKAGEVIVGKDPVRFEKALKMGEEMMEKLDGIASCLNSIVVETNAKESIKEILENAHKSSEKLNLLLGRLNDMAEENREGMKVTVANFKEVSTSLRSEMGKFSQSLTSLRNILGKIEGGEGTIGKLVTSEELYDELHAFIKDIEENPWKLFRKPKKTRKKPAK
ncbi:MAG: MlaD family protein [Candidatus Ratteibacteria bacterium]|nr:MlaD family protein [Candidatus Ratteibacteria bacterium]